MSLNGIVPLHETQEVYGVSEDCKFNDHPMCRNPRCGCSCHKQRADEAAKLAARNAALNRSVANTSQHEITKQTVILEKYCPKCGKKAGEDQNYCKVDGTRLSSLRCPECNQPGEEDDNFCGYCGCDMKTIRAMETEVELERAAMVEGEGDAVVAMRAAMDEMKMKGRPEVKLAATPFKPPANSINPGMFK